MSKIIFAIDKRVMILLQNNKIMRKEHGNKKTC